MNKALAFVLATAISISLVGCTSTPSPAAPTSTPSTTTSSVSSCEHQLAIHTQTSSTCATPGQITRVCGVCGEEFIETLPTISHTFNDATCLQARTCTLCGISEGDALGHNYVGGKCDRCNEAMPGYEDTPVGCTHEYILSDQAAPTCVDTGHLTYTCTHCNHSFTEDIPLKGHHFNDASCTEPGTCTVCGHTQGQALGHNYVDGTCNRCGEVDPSISVEVTFTVTVRSDKGKPAEGVTIRVYTTADTPAAIGRTNSKGVATMTLLSAKQYRVTLSDIPEGLSAKKSYTFSSTRVNINLSTVSVITPTDHSKANYKVGSKMGDFTLTDTDGNSYTLSQLLKEKDLVILNFWFVNCAPCKAEFPYFEDVYNTFNNVQLLTLNHIDSESQIKALRQQMEVTFPMISEMIGMQQGFDISAYPTTVFIDSSGTIRQIKIGEFKTKQELINMINRYL